MKSKRLPTVLFAILLGMGMTPCEAQAEESAAASAPVETTLTACVEEDATDALNDDGTEVSSLEGLAKRTAQLPEVWEEAGQGVDVTTSVDEGAPAGANEDAAEQEKGQLVAGDDEALMQGAPEVINKNQVDADGYAKQNVSKARDIDIKPGECVIYIDSTEYAMRYNKKELYLSGKNIVLENGAYNYDLYANASGKLTYDNDLEILYQGVNGKYNLHYDIVDNDHHTMVVNGLFYNIMKTSPLLKRYSNRISDDSYAYHLDLRTNESYSFNNHLVYRFDGKPRTYSVSVSGGRVRGTEAMIRS